MSRIIYIYLFVLISYFVSAQEIVYFPAGNKAYEIMDSIITFYKEDKPVRQIDFRNYTDKYFQSGTINFLWTHKYDSVTGSTYENKYNKLGLMYEEHSRVCLVPLWMGSADEYIFGDTIQYNQYGQNKRLYDEYGNVQKTRKSIKPNEKYDNQERLVQITEREIGSTFMRNAYYKYDSLGRLAVEYSDLSSHGEVDLYIEYHYADFSQTPHRTYRFRSSSFWIDEEIYFSELHKQETSRLTKVPYSMPLDELMVFIDSIRQDETQVNMYRQKDIYYISPHKKSKEVEHHIIGNSRFLTEYKYDFMGRLSEEIVYNTENRIISNHFYSYSHKNMDFKQK